jgi:hypothetical protein
MEPLSGEQKEKSSTDGNYRISTSMWGLIPYECLDIAVVSDTGGMIGLPS